MIDIISSFCVICSKVLNILCRTRRYRHTHTRMHGIESSSTETGPSTLQLVRIGCGRGLGIGIFIVVGQTTSQFTGPTIVAALTIALLLAVFTGLCFADVINSVPLIQGAPFFFTYIRGGEFIAVNVGWSYILCHVTMSALSARALAEHVDCIIGGKLRYIFTSIFPAVSVDDYSNCLALAVVIVAIGYVAIGAKRTNVSHYSSDVTAIFALLLIVAVGYIKGDGDNYSKGVPFLNHGQEGVSKVAAVCFYLFTGFEAITTIIRTPYKRMIQKQVTSFMASSLFNFVAFNLAAISMLFIVSSDKMNNNCSFGSFGFDGQRWLEIFVNLLSLPALGVVMATNLFIAVHSVYLMSIEGIIPCVFGALYRRTDTPLSSALGVGLVTGILATILSQFRLLQLSAIGTLFTYMLVCISDILMRYRPVQTDDEDTWQDEYSDTEHDEGNGEPAVECHVTGTDTTTIENSNIRFAKIESLGKCKRNVLYADTEKSDESSESDRETDDIDQIVADYKEKLRVASLTQFGSKRKRGRAKEPTSFTLTLVNICLICDMVCQCCIGVILHQYSEQLQQLKTVTFAIFLVTCLLSLIACITIAKQPQLRMDGPSSMILFPWIPLICVFGFIYLMFSLDGATWIVFTLWLSIGMLVYAVYGACHSVEAKRYTYVLPEEQERVLLKPIPKQSLMMEYSPGQRKYKQNIGYQYFHEIQ